MKHLTLTTAMATLMALPALMARCKAIWSTRPAMTLE